MATPLSDLQPAPIRDPAQLEALAEPTRFAIFETLQLGPASIREIAEHLDRPAGSLYRHIALLEALGLVKRVEQVPTERRAAWVYASFEPLPALTYQRGDDDSNRALGKVIDALTQRAAREFTEALLRGDVRTRGPQRNAFASQFQGWLNADELAQVNDLLDQLVELLRAGTRRADTQLVSLATVLRPPRTGSSGDSP
ncbi:MAG: hypothetical protein DHS20C15_33550 [Planctomycetota bacterium]|nr:MAG: hypothetical protein DHS20C15_33550 [Planctomycetota bacterium]